MSSTQPEFVGFRCTVPERRTLEALASRRRTSMSEAVRRAIRAEAVRAGVIPSSDDGGEGARHDQE